MARVHSNMSSDPDNSLRVTDRPAGVSGDRGSALVMTVLVIALLWIVVWQLVSTAETARMVGENDLVMARMTNHMDYSRSQVEDMLIQDMDAASAASEGGGEGGGAGGLEGMLGGAAGGGAPGGGEGGGEEGDPDPAAIADGSQDEWFEPTAYTDEDITTYVWIEDENRKFNILTLVSPDQEFADASRERFVRLIDALREDTDFDLSRSDGELLYGNIRDWMETRSRGETLPQPLLKSDDEDRPAVSLPLQLDEIRLLQGVDDELFYDKVLDGQVILGLQAVLTVQTSKTFWEGDPEDPNEINRGGSSGQGGQPGTGAPGEGGGEGAGGGEGGGAVPGGGEGGGGGGLGEEGGVQPVGVGIRININTAPRAVLRCLFPPGEFPDSAIDAIIRFRNEEVEEDPLADESGDLASTGDYTTYLQEGQEVRRKMFTDLSELDELPEFDNLPDPAIKDEFKLLVGVTSDVFTLHMAAMHKRSEEHRNFVLRRSRSIVMRLEGQEAAEVHPFVLAEQSYGLRIKWEDIVDVDLLQRASQLDELDAFSQEEKAWNPFLIDFYRPKDERDQLFNYQQRLR